MTSFRQIVYHIVFATKNRRPTIVDAHAQELFRYITAIIKNCKGKLHQINCMPDHIHILCDLPPTISLAEYIKTIKVASSIWMRESNKFPEFDGWQEGYGAFTHNIKQRDKVIRIYCKSKGTPPIRNLSGRIQTTTYRTRNKIRRTFFDLSFRAAIAKSQELIETGIDSVLNI